MALPVAHFSVALGMTGSRRLGVLAFLAFLSIVPDFDFAAVWWLKFPVESAHRTWSHSLFFFAALAVLWHYFRPAGLRDVSPALFFAVLVSHSLVDLLCTTQTASHGVMMLWPISDVRLGWPVLVPIYLLVGQSPFSTEGLLRFTLLEVVLAPFLWFVAVLFRKCFVVISERVRAPEDVAETADRRQV